MSLTTENIFISGQLDQMNSSVFPDVPRNNRVELPKYANYNIASQSQKREDLSAYNWHITTE